MSTTFFQVSVGIVRVRPAKSLLAMVVSLVVFGTTGRTGDAEQAEQAERKAGSDVAGDCCWAPG